MTTWRLLCFAALFVVLATPLEGMASVLSIRAAGASSWLSESETLDVVESGAAVLEVRVQNTTEEAKAVRVRQAEVTPGFETTYSAGDEDITAAVLGLGWSTPVLEPGASVFLSMSMRSLSGEVGSEGTVSLEGTWDETVEFEIEDGGTVPTEDYNVDVTVLGCAMSYGGDYDMPITATVCIGDEFYTPWGNPDSVTQANLNDGRNPRTFLCPETYAAGTPVWIRSTCWYKARSYYDGSSDSHWVTYRDVDSSPATSRVHVLRNGDPVPDVEGYLNQADLSFFVRDYVQNGRIVLTENQTIYLFEYTSYLTSSSADFQDLVVLVTLSAAGASEEGGGEVVTAPMEVWGVDDSHARLRYYVIGENVVAKRDDGELQGISGGRDVEALTFAGDGSIYFMNNVGSCVLYQIPASELDHSAASPVNAQLVGDTGLPAGSTDHEITSLQFIDGVLYGITKKSKLVYRFDTTTGEAHSVCSLNYSDRFKTGALTQAANGSVYAARFYSSNSRLYRFSSFPGGGLTRACTFPESGAIHAVAAHPNGSIYATDRDRWFRYDPGTDEVTVVDDLPSDLEGMDFNYRLEATPPAGDDDDDDDDGGGAEVYTLAVTLVVQEAERRQADLHVALSGDELVGDDSHAPLSGAPTLTVVGSTRAVVAFDVRVENDGNREEQLRVKLAEALSHDRWIVRFFAGGEGGAEITDGVTGEGWLTDALVPGASADLRVEVVPGAVEQQLSIAVGAASATVAGQGLDVVRLLTVRGAVGGRVRVRSWRELRD
ncbi:MAG: hypothetical protein HN742_42235 [Lentisphaerae bacterium]|jgi:hypothetical protein|nr:hypothetical protein [Lentisphaerota bacterium]MBT5605924.1 hypothetical protein [Lentisphaerota bacterium]MBT7058003.1 hypothetical protein [Lentisphaerota bacterium]MBT7848558.1 hypothetical protein [Lentisphaerota bacterium]